MKFNLVVAVMCERVCEKFNFGYHGDVRESAKNLILVIAVM